MVLGIRVSMWEIPANRLIRCYQLAFTDVIYGVSSMTGTVYYLTWLLTAVVRGRSDYTHFQVSKERQNHLYIVSEVKYVRGRLELNSSWLQSKHFFNDVLTIAKLFLSRGEFFLSICSVYLCTLLALALTSCDLTVRMLLEYLYIKFMSMVRKPRTHMGHFSDSLGWEGHGGKVGTCLAFSSCVLRKRRCPSLLPGFQWASSGVVPAEGKKARSIAS